MTSQGNLAPTTAIADGGDTMIRQFLETLRGAADRPLVFTYGDREIQAGYHVTEVKAGRFESLDCGANPESWTEVFVQLWDVNEDRTHMPAGKFVKIMGKVIDHVALGHDARLTFEVSDGKSAMQLYRAGPPRLESSAVWVDLSPRPASCKPRDRWLEQQNSCMASLGAKPCCG